MKQFILITFAVSLFTNGIFAQTLTPNVQPTQGGYASGSNVSLSWTMGQTFNPTLTGGSTELSQGMEQPEIDIITGAITGGPFCTSQPFNVTFTAYGYVDPSNVFTAQLSDAGGSFASPTILGTLAGDGLTGTIPVTVPASIASGNGYLVRVISSNPVFNGKVTATAISIGTCGNTWTANSSTDPTAWSDPANWSAGVAPNSCGDDITIPGGMSNYPVLSSNSSVGKVNMGIGASINLQSYTLSVCNNWTARDDYFASVTGTTGLLIFNGSAAQTISGRTSVGEMVINNPSGVSLLSSAELNVNTALDLQAGNFDVTSGDITFISTLSYTAIIDNFSSGYSGTLTGNINAQQAYQTPAHNSYSQHQMGTPINSMPLSQYRADGGTGFVTPMTDCDETQLAIGSNYGNVFSFHENAGATCELAQWEVMGAQGESAQNGLGYSVILTGTGVVTVSGPTNLSTTNPITISGLSNSAYTATTSFQGRQYQPGWQMLANPYLATIVIDPTVNQSDFDNQLWVWDAISGSYINPPNNAIAPFEAFWVHKTNGGGTSTYTINPTWRTRTVTGTFYQMAADQLTLVTQNMTTGMLDQITVGFNAAATDTFDARYDANKLAGSLNRQTMYSVISTGTRMATNILHDEATTSTVPVGFEPGNTATYDLSFNGINSFDPTSYIYLEDNFLNIWHDARSGDYVFNSDSADRWNRFVLHFTPPAVINTLDATCNSAGTISIQQPGTAYWNYTLTDSNSTVITSGVLNQNQSVTVDVAAGTYLLTLTDTNGYVAVKPIQVNGTPMIAASFQASRDTAFAQQNVVLTATTANATSYAWNLGNGTTATGENATVSYTQPGTYTVSLLVTNQAGCSSTQTHVITVLPASTTGLNNVSGTGSLNIWSNSNKVYVDFTALSNVDATVIMYDILGQQICSDKVTSNVLYQKEIDNILAAYFVVMVKNDDKITTKKVFITNSK